MDFSTFNTKGAADDGAKLHFVHPVMGHYLYDGPGADSNGRLVDPKKKHDEVSAIIRGYHAPTVQSALSKGNAEKMSPAQQAAAGRKLIDALIVSWQGITDGDGKPLPCTAENKHWLTEQNHSIFQQIDAFAKEQANFFPEG